MQAIDTAMYHAGLSLETDSKDFAEIIVISDGSGAIHENYA